MIAGWGAWRVWLGAAACALMLLACGDDDDGARPDAGDASTAELEVEIGRPGGDDGLQFVPFEAGGDLPIETFGQGGTHVMVAVRVHGLGSNTAFLDVTLLNLKSGARAMTAPTTRPQLWYCPDEDASVCEQTRVFVMLGGIAKPAEKDGLRVRVIADVTATDGRRGEATSEGVLRAPAGGIREDGGFVGDAAAQEDVDAGL